MKITRQQRNEIPREVENIGLGKWHIRWDVAPVEETIDGETTIHYEYNEVIIDHEPTQEEITKISQIISI